VQSRAAGIGEFVAAGTPIVEVVKTDPLRLRVSVPERFATQVRVGHPIRLLTGEGDTNRYEGRVSRLSPALEEQSRMLIVEADVPARQSLQPGLFARAELVLAEGEPGLAVPSDALTTFAGLEKVILAQDGKAEERVVTTGRRGRDWVEILSGLTPGEFVVMRPSGLRTGSPVAVGKGLLRPASTHTQSGSS
jgi:RND family efflux transporter MFP subunit